MADQLSPSGAGLITNTLAECGPACAQSVFTLRDTLRQIRGSAALNEAIMAHLIHFFSQGTDWNQGNIAQVLSEDYSHLNWDQVALSFDFPEFHIRDRGHLKALVELYKAAAKKVFPVQALTMSQWSNSSGLLSFIENSFVLPESIVYYPLTEDEERNAAIADHLQNTVCINKRAWASQQVMLLLMKFSDDPNLLPRVQNLFRDGIAIYPEIIVCTFTTILTLNLPMFGEKLKNAVLQEIINVYFVSPKVRNIVGAIKTVLAISEQLTFIYILQAWKNAHVESRVNILDNVVSLVARVEPDNYRQLFLGGNRYQSDRRELNLGVAMFLHDRNKLGLEDYLKSQFECYKTDAVIDVISFISKHHDHMKVVNYEVKKSLLCEATTIICFKFLETLEGSNILSQSYTPSNTGMTLGESKKALWREICEKHPRINEQLRNPTSKDDIEEEANKYFQQIYKGEKDIDDVIRMLTQFKKSGSSRENDIFACMIHNLFDEYRFFSKYPDKELRITGILFGKLIQEQLVSSITLGIALRYVLEALRKTGNKKMFTFGMYALEQFKDRLHEWPQYCSHIVQIQGLKDNYQELVNNIEAARQQHAGQNAGAASIGSVTNDSTSVSSESKNTARVPSTVNVQIPNGVMHSSLDSAPPSPIKREAVFGPGLGRAVTESKEDVQHEGPSGQTKDRIQKLMNNVTADNAEQTAMEVKSILDRRHFNWLGHYLVVKRISSQVNYHHVYLSFLEHLGDYGKELFDAILSSLYLNVGSLLKSKEITSSSNKRTVLKTLGSWLGLITLARNKPILQITLDCKELLYQGYETGRLIAITPFVAKILEGAKNSPVFRPPNPWVMGLLGVFRSLYEVEDLKMNIKFEVEVLCKNLGLSLSDIPLRGEDLAKRIPPNKISNQDFNVKSSGANSQRPGTPGGEKSVGGAPATSTPSIRLGASSPAATVSKHQQTVIPNLDRYVTINPDLVQLFQQLGPSSLLDESSLKRCVPIAVDRAIRDIIQPVVERSVTIACITTKEIVTKDFAMESDEKKMRKYAQLMVANLAGSLALVACREPLKVSISTHLKQLLVNTAAGNTSGTNSQASALGEAAENVIDQCVAIVSQDNLDLGCTLIEKAATEKAVRDIEESICDDLAKRQKHREMTGKPFFDMSIFNPNQRYPENLPEPLRPKPGGLRREQLQVYEAFHRIPRQPTAQQNNSLNSASVTGSASGRFNFELITNIATKLENSVTTTLAQYGARAPEITLSKIHAEHDIKKLILAAKHMTMEVAENGTLSVAEKDSALGFAQHIFKRLYELRLSEPLRLEAFVALLEALNICCRDLENNLGTWATYAPSETDAQRKLHRTVLLLLLRSKLLQVSGLDRYLCERIDRGRNIVWLEFTMALIRTAVHEKIFNLKDLPQTIGVIVELSKSGGQSNQIAQWLRVVEESSHDKNVTQANPSVLNASVQMKSVPTKASRTYKSSISMSSLANLASAPARALESIKTTSRDDPQNLKERIIMLLDGWMRIINDVGSTEKQLQYIQLLQQNGIGSNEEQNERFFRVSTEVLVTAVLKDSNEKKTLNYNVIDSYSKLIVALMTNLNPSGNSDDIGNQRVALLNQILGVTMRTMMASYENAKRSSAQKVPKWDQRPWFRLLLNLVMDLNSPSPVFDPIGRGIRRVFGSAFHVVQPLVIPGFAFAWLELISHRMFLCNLLSEKGQNGFGLAHQLLIDLLLFLEPHLKQDDMSESMTNFFKGSMRVLLLLLHDFPSFLASFHLSFCNVIPENCIQLRSVILSAVPRGMNVPDPFTPNLKIDVIPEMSQNPAILSNVVGPINAMRNDLDNFLKNRQSTDFLRTLLPRLYKDGSKEIDHCRVNALVLYLGMHAVARQQNSQISNHSAEMDIMQKLMELNDHGRYIVLNAVANNLRFPSSHTHYFSCVMLFLFSEGKDEGVREQVTRVLLERLIVHRPHPWGLVVTFIELIKNQRYQFWSHPFTRCATEIEKVFEGVARSCLTPSVQKD